MPIEQLGKPLSTLKPHFLQPERVSQSDGPMDGYYTSTKAIGQLYDDIETRLPTSSNKSQPTKRKSKRQRKKEKAKLPIALGGLHLNGSSGSISDAIGNLANDVLGGSWRPSADNRALVEHLMHAFCQDLEQLASRAAISQKASHRLTEAEILAGEAQLRCCDIQYSEG